MTDNSPIFTKEEIKFFWYEIRAKFKGGIRSSINIFYISLTLIGVAWATYAIPSLNRSEISPETLGIYVIGFLISVMLDSLVTWKKQGDDNGLEQTIAALFFVISFLLVIASSFLSIKTFPSDSSGSGQWKCYAYPFLGFILVFAILISIVITGIDQKSLPIGPLDVAENAIHDRVN